MFSFCTEPHDRFNHRSVVPASIKHDQLAGRRQMSNIALKIPLCSLYITGFFKRNDPGTPRVQVFHDSLNRATLACGITTLEDHQDFQACIFNVILKFQQLNLQPSQLFFVFYCLFLTPNLDFPRFYFSFSFFFFGFFPGFFLSFFLGLFLSLFLSCVHGYSFVLRGLQDVSTNLIRVRRVNCKVAEA